MTKFGVTYPAIETVLIDNTDEKVMGKLNITEIIKNNGSKLRRFIRSKVKSTDDADDIFQEVFYRLAEADNLMKPVDQVSGWLYTVARNRITDLYRKKKPGSISEYISDNAEELYDEIGNLIFDEGSTPETDYLRTLVWEELESALNDLPEEQRFVFEQTEMKGVSFKDISKLTGLPVNTLISRKRYAVLFLRERLLYLHDELLLF
jgi:RNA polymerase sigma factor (sigma-70 family)